MQTYGNVDYLRIEKPNQKNFHENQLLLHIEYVAMHYERWKLDEDSKYAKFGLVWDYKCIQITYRKLFAPRTQQIAERSQNKICAKINWFLMKEIPQNTKIQENTLHCWATLMIQSDTQLLQQIWQDWGFWNES